MTVGNRVSQVQGNRYPTRPFYVHRQAPAETSHQDTGEQQAGVVGRIVRLEGLPG